MKKRSFIFGILTMLLISMLVGTASAKLEKVTQELEYRNISVTLDGKKLDLRDAQGNSVEPFMFNGTNYLPVRALAESLGLNVAWDGSTATVVLTSPDIIVETSEVLLGAKENVRLYYTGLIKKADGGYDFKIRCENDSDYKIFVYPFDFTINGKTILNLATAPSIHMNCVVEPGRSLDTVVSVDKSAIDKYEIDEVKRFKTGFSGYDTAKSGWDFTIGGTTINID